MNCLRLSEISDNIDTSDRNAIVRVDTIQKGDTMETRTICVGAIKGGSGKTTTAVALAQCAATDGKRVLLIDLDQQGNATASVGAQLEPNGALALLHDDRPLNIQHTAQNIYCIAGAPDLAAETTSRGSFKRLNAALDPIRDEYDLIIMDTAPSTTECLYNALFAADTLIVPLYADVMNLQALLDIAAIYEEVQHHNQRLVHAGAVLTNYDGRPKIHRAFRDAIAQKGSAAGIPLIGTIRAGVSLQESQFFARNLYEYAPNSKPALDYRALYETLIEG